MEEQLISFETAKLAKEKGMYVICPKCDCKDIQTGNIYYEMWADALSDFREILHYRPIQSLLQKWLREKHNIHISIDYEQSNKWVFYLGKFPECETYAYQENFNSYEEALEVGLQEALKLIK